LKNKKIYFLEKLVRGKKYPFARPERAEKNENPLLNELGPENFGTKNANARPR
jgi:hypothetical protein